MGLKTLMFNHTLSCFKKSTVRYDRLSNRYPVTLHIRHAQGCWTVSHPGTVSHPATGNASSSEATQNNRAQRITKSLFHTIHGTKVVVPLTPRRNYIANQDAFHATLDLRI